MIYFFILLKTALADFSRNKARTLLTSLGILIGVLSVVLLTAFGLGLKKYIQNEFESLGSNNIRVIPGQVLQNGGFRASPGSIGSIRFDERDFQSLKRLQSLLYVVPVFTKTVTATVGKHNEIGDLYTTSSDVFPALTLKAQYGRVFSKSDEEKRTKIVVIGPKIAEKLFGTAKEGVGKTLKIGSQKLRVIGVLESKGGGGLGPDLDSFMYMPYKAGYVFNTDKKFLAFIVKAKNENRLEQAKDDVRTLLLKRYEKDDFSIVEQTEILNAVSSIFAILNTVLVAIAAISLIVGGIGIMNIMFVSVSERIKEIGIRRALGARQYDILLLFLVESVLLSLMGGLLGLGLAFIIVLLIQPLFPAYINFQSVALALGVSSFIGVVFGVFPAKKASDLSPIEAIRYE